MWEAAALAASDTQQLFGLLLPLWHSPPPSPPPCNTPTVCTPGAPSPPWPQERSRGAGSWAGCRRREGSASLSLGRVPGDLRRRPAHASKCWRTPLWERGDLLVKVTLLNTSFLGTAGSAHVYVRTLGCVAGCFPLSAPGRMPQSARAGPGLWDGTQLPARSQNPHQIGVYSAGRVSVRDVET